MVDVLTSENAFVKNSYFYNVQHPRITSNAQENREVGSNQDCKEFRQTAVKYASLKEACRSVQRIFTLSIRTLQKRAGVKARHFELIALDYGVQVLFCIFRLLTFCTFWASYFEELQESDARRLRRVSWMDLFACVSRYS